MYTFFYALSKPNTLFFLILILTIAYKPAFAQTAGQSAGHAGSGFRCGTCDYFHEQHERIRAGKKPISDGTTVSIDFWENNGQSQPLDAYQWPGRYYHVLDNRTDSDGDGLRECRFIIDFDDFHTAGIYTPEETGTFVEEFRRCIGIYNEALRYVGLEFKEVETRSDAHVIIQATNNAQLLTVIGRATYFGAWGVDDPIFYLKSTYEHFGAFLELADNGAPEALYKGPPGNPFQYIFPVDRFEINEVGNFRWNEAISDTMLHELGHLIGLMHPFEALSETSEGGAFSYSIDWLAWRYVNNPPPGAPSTLHAGEEFSASGWARGLFSTFMTYDRRSSHALYPVLPSQVKAFIAHYYGFNNPAESQVLLDLAQQEFYETSPIRRGEMAQEREPNDGRDSAVPLQPGLPVLGALSSVDPADPFRSETFDDDEDWYAFQVSPMDAGREIEIEVSIGSIVYQHYYFTYNGNQVDGFVRLSVIDELGRIVSESGQREEFPSLTFVPDAAGTYFARISADSNREVFKDYTLSVAYTDNQPAFAPTFTPTPTPTAPPLVFTPTPVSPLADIDIAIGELWLVENDGGGSFDDDVIIEHPDRNQSIRFLSRIFNSGRNEIPSYRWECYVDGELHASSSTATPIPVNNSWRWRTSAWTGRLSGVYEVEWRFYTDGEGNPENNVRSMRFAVGNAVLPPEVPVAVGNWELH